MRPVPMRVLDEAHPWQEIAARWGELVPRVRRQWPELTYMEVMAVAGQRGRLCGLICRRYEVTHEDADDMLFAWQARLLRQERLEAVGKVGPRTD